jgi:hypothetical protein
LDVVAIIADVKNPGMALLTVCVFLLTACTGGKPDQAAVEAALKQRFAKSGLTPDTMNMEFKSLKTEGNQVKAEILLFPKGMPGSAQTWQYTLESKGGKLEVVGTPEMKRNGVNEAPVDHKSAPTPPPSQSTPQPNGALPPGHPPVAN